MFSFDFWLPFPKCALASNTKRMKEISFKLKQSITFNKWAKDECIIISWMKTVKSSSRTIIHIESSEGKI